MNQEIIEIHEEEYNPPRLIRGWLTKFLLNWNDRDIEEKHRFYNKTNIIEFHSSVERNIQKSNIRYFANTRNKEGRTVDIRIFYEQEFDQRTFSSIAHLIHFFDRKI